MISRLLVANRGEIARRVFRTCRDLGIETVAVFSDPDAGLPHAVEADRAVRLPGAAPAETYLDQKAILDAARTAGADAIHPGYGFLSENAGFAEAVTNAARHSGADRLHLVLERVEQGPGEAPALRKEPLAFEYVHLTQRSYK